MAESLDPQSWKRLDELFQRALDLPSARRPEFLAAECADPAMLRKLNAMLAAVAEPEDLLAVSVETVARDLLAPTVRPPLDPGCVVDRYEILSLVGSGGMGRVYRARDKRLDRDVAIKTLAPERVPNSRGLRLFEQEARAASALNHPNILTIYEIGEVNGLRFIASEFVEGATLAVKLAAGPLDISQALDISIQTVSGLVAAHAAGIVHRDIKPENLILRTDGIVKIVDFGIAKLSEERSAGASAAAASTEARTHPGTIIGTAKYMSPEQARGALVDGRTDIFSLGTVVYEMIAGRAPFQGETDSDVLAEILKTEPPPIEEAHPGTPRELSRIVALAMRKNREERYQSAGLMLAELQSLRDELAFQAKLTASAPPHRVAVTRRTVLAAVAATATAIAVYAWRTNSRRAPARPRGLAILPFRNIGPDPGSDFVGFSLADAIITKLGSIATLTVRPSSAVAAYRNREADPRKVGADLKVDALLTGSYIKDGPNLRITTQLVDTKGLNILWQDTIDVRYDNLLDVNDRVAEKIISGLELNLAPAEIEGLKRGNPTNGAAYEDYLRGVDLYAMNDFESSIAMLERSTASDANYAPAWMHLGRAYEANASLQFGGRAQYRKAQAAFERALSLDSASIDTRVYMANLLTDSGRVEEAVPLLRAALEKNPNSAAAHWELGYAYRFGGLLEDSVRECELARRIDPSFKIASSAINAYFYLGRYDDWLASLPDSNSAYILFYRGLGEYYKSDFGQAAAHFNRAYDLDPALLQADIGKAFSYRIADRYAQGVQILRELESKILDRGVTDAEGIYKVGQAYTILGDKPSALRLLRRAIEGGFFPYSYIQADPLLANVRQEREINPLMEEARRRSQAFQAKFSPAQRSK